MSLRLPNLRTALVILAALSFLPACSLFPFSPAGPTPEEQARAEARRQLHQADLFIAQQLPDSALSSFGLALMSDPNLPQAYLGMGQIYRQRGNLPAAGRAYEQAAVIAPASFDAQFYLAQIKHQLGRFEEAIRAYLRALTIDPYSFEANRDLASAYLEAGRPSFALHYAQRATELRSDDAAAWFNLGKARRLTGNPKDALSALKYAASLNPQIEAIPLELAAAQIDLKQYDQAAATLKALVADHPSALAYERLGYCQFFLHQFDVALASYRQAVTLDPKDVPALNGLGAALMTVYAKSGGASGQADRGQRDQAMEAWKQSLRQNPNQPRIVDLISRYQKF